VNLENLDWPTNCVGRRPSKIAPSDTGFLNLEAQNISANATLHGHQIRSGASPRMASPVR